MQPHKPTLTTFLVLLCCGVGHAKPARPTRGPKAPAKIPSASARTQDDIREAAVRYFMPPYGGALFVDVVGSAPSPGLLRRFRSDKVLVRSRSQAKGKPERGGDPWQTYYVDKATGRKGGLLVLGPIKWQSSSEVQINVDRSASGDVLTLSQQGKRWVVTKKELRWIS